MDPAFPTTAEDLFKKALEIDDILKPIEHYLSSDFPMRVFLKSWITSLWDFHYDGPFHKRCEVQHNACASRKRRKDLLRFCDALLREQISMMKTLLGDLKKVSDDSKFQRALEGIRCRLSDTCDHPNVTETITRFQKEVGRKYGERIADCAPTAVLKKYDVFFERAWRLRAAQEEWEIEYLGFEKMVVPDPEDGLQREEEESSKAYYTRVREELERRFRESVGSDLESERSAFENEVRQRFEEQAEREFAQYVAEETKRQDALERENEAAFNEDRARVDLLKREVDKLSELGEAWRRAEEVALQNAPLLPEPENNAAGVWEIWKTLQEDEAQFKSLTEGIERLQSQGNRLAHSEDVLVKHLAQVSRGEFVRDTAGSARDV
jgi:hypothetical protein